MKTIIIAEAGVNHNGSIDIARKLIEVAKDSGADYVKFQTFKAENLATKFAEKANYQKNNTENSSTQFEMLKELELNLDEHKELIEYCNNLEIKFLSTAFDIESVKMLSDLNIPLFKIPSGEITNIPYLRTIGELDKPIILSTGMSTMVEIELALNTLISSGASRDKITVLHCNTEYPTPIGDVNLNAMVAIKNKFKTSIGYSDHTLGFETSIAAVALGACVIEKHFTLDTQMKGPDHKASLNPKDFSLFVESIRNTERLLGNELKHPSPSEKKNIKIARKSIVAKKTIRIGDVFSEDNLTTKRPGIGISPINWDSLIGKKSNKNFDIDELITI